MAEIQFTLPEDYTKVTDLDALKLDIVRAYSTLKSSAEMTADVVAEMRDLSLALKAVNTEHERREDVARQLAEIDGEFTALTADPEPAADPEPEPAPTEPAPEAVAPGEENSGNAAPTEPVAVAPAVPAPVEPAAPAPEPTPTPAPEAAAPEPATDLQPVAASAINTNGPTMAEIAARTPAPAASGLKPIMFSANDVPDQPLGTPLTLASFSQALVETSKLMEGSTTGGVRSLATIKRDFDPALFGNGNTDVTEIARVASDSALGRGPVSYAVTCAPPQQLNTICSRVDVNEGIAAWPTIPITSETITWRRGVDWCAPELGTGFGTWTEEMAGDPEAVKECAEVICLPGDECTIEPDWLCTITDLMKYRFDRIAVEDFMEKQLLRYNRYINAKKIAQVVAAAGPPISLGAKFGATARLADAILLIATDIRKRQGMSRTAQIRVRLPWETPELLMAAEGYRDDITALELSMTRLVGMVAKHNVSVDFIHGLQFGLGSPPDSPGDAPAECTTDPAVEWPDMLRILAYPEGAWVSPMAQIINVTAEFPYELLRQNKLLLRFREEAACMIDLCPGTRVYEVPVCVNGTVGARAASDETFVCA